MSIDLGEAQGLGVGASGSAGVAIAGARTRPDRGRTHLMSDVSVKVIFADVESLDPTVVARTEPTTRSIAAASLSDAQAATTRTLLPAFRVAKLAATDPYATGSTVTVDGVGAVAA